jgi:hypothetical protein
MITHVTLCVTQVVDFNFDIIGVLFFGKTRNQTAKKKAKQ